MDLQFQNISKPHLLTKLNLNRLNSFRIVFFVLRLLLLRLMMLLFFVFIFTKSHRNTLIIKTTSELFQRFSRDCKHRVGTSYGQLIVTNTNTLRMNKKTQFNEDLLCGINQQVNMRIACHFNFKMAWYLIWRLSLVFKYIFLL